MPAIPYQPVPQIAPTEAATPRPNVDTPNDAFGGGIAHAVEGLGAVTTQAGNELYGRAVALQQLNNETEAREADAKYMLQAGDLHAKFNSLEGQERVAAFPKYSQDLQDLRVQLRGDLSNPMSQKMYDSSSLSTMGRSIFNGAGAAATAQKEAAHTAINAKSDLLTKAVYDDPSDETAFRTAVDDARQTAVSKAALTPGGASPDRVELIQRQSVSTIAANRILGMARNQPKMASDLLTQYKDEGLLFGKDYEAVSNKVQSYTQTVGTNTIADQVLQKHLQKDGTYDASASDMQAEAVKVATDTYPDDPKMGTAAQNAFDHNFNQHQWAAQQDERQRKQQISDYIVKGTSSIDLLPPALVKQMTPTEIKAFPAQANSYQRSVDTQTNQDAYQKYLGLYNNDNGKFMETDFLREPGLNKANIDFFMRLQRTATANGDPRVGKALSTLRGAVPSTLESLSIYRRDQKNPEDYDRFTGALHEAIQSWQENTGKPPSEKELTKEIFPNLIMQVTDPGRFYDGKAELYKAGLPDGVKEAAEKDAGKALTDDEVRSAYLRTQFNTLFGSKGKKSQDRVQ